MFIVDGWKSYKYFRLIKKGRVHILNEALALYLRSNGIGMEETEKLLFSEKAVLRDKE
ncbi:MAG: hypothetical protein ACREBQ_01275 [Nitrososphaerales archaeon]